MLLRRKVQIGCCLLNKKIDALTEKEWDQQSHLIAHRYRDFIGCIFCAQRYKPNKLEEIKMTVESYLGSYVLEDHKGWKLLAAIDESESYEVDITEIYLDPKTGKFFLATASGCSCWGGEYDVEEFISLDKLGDSIFKSENPERHYNPSFKAAEQLLAQARTNWGG